MLQASSIELYAGECLVVCGKLYAIPQTSSNRDATCMAVVKGGALTIPVQYYQPCSIFSSLYLVTLFG